LQRRLAPLHVVEMSAQSVDPRGNIVAVPFQPRVTVVGGGGGAIGSAVVARLAASGHHVVVPTRHPGRSAAQPGVTEIECDLDDVAAVARLREAVEALGRWEGVVSASGGYATGKAHELDDEAIESQIAANLMGPWHLARAAAESMLAAGGGGRMVIVGSRASVDVNRNQAAYQVTKAAVLRLTQVMAAELRASGVTVNAVLPGTVDTESNREAMPKADRSSWVTADSVAAVIEWLLSDAAAIVTGAAIPAG
jgi:NAD(P)-dependent dehydrogenase (short-subunit alcohol dehydrogenase family)